MNNCPIQVKTILNEENENLFQSLKETFQLENTQTYFPIMNKFMQIYNTRECIANSAFQTKYRCIKINKIDDDDDDDSEDVSNCIKVVCTISKLGKEDTYNEHAIVKIAPILNPIKILNNEFTNLVIRPVSPTSETEYDLEDLETVDIFENEVQPHQTWQLPSLVNSKTIETINSIHNTTHVETFAMFLLSNMAENGKCPTFPYFYGSVSGIKKTYFHDITDEYPELSHTKFFRAQKNKLFNLIFMDENGEDNFSQKSSNDITSIPDCIGNIEMKDLDNISDISDIDYINNMASLNINNNNTEIAENINNNTEIAEITEITENAEVAENDEVVECNKLPETSSISNGSDYETLSDTSTSSDEQEIRIDHILNKKSYKNGYDNISDTDSVYFNGVEKYARFADFPVQINIMQKFDYTLDQLMLRDDYEISLEEWSSILFQIIFALAVAQKEYSFAHNDIHSDNVMFSNTKEPYIYYHINDTIYKVPTFNRVAKLIDFARGTFKVDGKWYISDVFENGGEADGQYEYDLNDFKPNHSFDLARLASSIIDNVNVPEIEDILRTWIKTTSGYDVMEDKDTFDIYIKIAKECFNAVPTKVIKHKLFQQFKITKKQKPNNTYVYYYK